MHFTSKKLEALKLRKEGFSYSYISAKLGMAKSTLSLWLKNVSFVPNEFTKDGIICSEQRLTAIKRSHKLSSVQSASEYASVAVGKLSARDIFILGLGIYIGEGSKSNNFVRVVNSDPKIIKFTIKWLKESFDLKDSNFKIRIHIYPDNKENEVIGFWMRELELPRKAFHPCYVDRRLNKSQKRKRQLSQGTAHLTVVSNGDKTLGVLLHRKILASIDRVLSETDLRD